MSKLSRGLIFETKIDRIAEQIGLDVQAFLEMKTLMIALPSASVNLDGGGIYF